MPEEHARLNATDQVRIDIMRINRREFGKLVGLSVAGVAGLNMRAFAQAAETQPGGPYPDNFRDVHKDLIVIDSSAPLLSLPKPAFMDPLLDIFQMYRAGGTTVAFASVGSDTLETTLDWMSYVDQRILTDDNVMLCRTVADIREAKATGKLGIVHQFQPPSALEGNLNRVWHYKQSGLGICQITYNTRNSFGSGSGESDDEGLTPAGRDLIYALNEARVIVDIAHGGDKTALDTLEASDRIVVNSHGNARSVINSARNFPDEVLKGVAQKGGVCGVAGWPPFISTEKRPSMDDMIRMIDYMVELCGIDHVCIGMDYFIGQAGIMPDDQANKVYDYFTSSGEWQPPTYPSPPWWYPEGIETPDKLANLTGALMARGYSVEDIAKIWGGNWLRVMEEIWGA
jgi:membrane dipeptidase